MLAGLKEVIAEGKKRNIAIGSFNTPNLECILAVLDAAEELDVPVIIAHAQCHEDVAPCTTELDNRFKYSTINAGESISFKVSITVNNCD